MGSPFPKVREFLLSAPLLEGCRLRVRSIHADVVLAILSRLMARRLPLNSEPIMVIAPHQDDETLGCGGLIALKRQQGIEVHVVFLTDGGQSPLPPDGGVDREELPRVRVLEARAAMRELGVPESSVHGLGLPDGKLKQLPEAARSEAIDRLCALIGEHEPASVFVPHWDDGHGDHEAGFEMAVEAVRRTNSGIRVFQYTIWGPWLHPLYRAASLRDLRSAYRLPIGEVQAEKIAAIQAYTSQLVTLPAGFLDRFYRPYELFFPLTVSVAPQRV